MCVYVCVYICMCVYVYVCVYVGVCTCVRVHVHTCIFTFYRYITLKHTKANEFGVYIIIYTLFLNKKYFLFSNKIILN